MPKSTQAELADLRDAVFERDGYRCVWPGCDVNLFMDGPAEWSEMTQLAQSTLVLAHLTHRGMGGSKERNTPENCVTLCEIHHDCLDGRTGLGILRRELNAMLAAQIR